jgi:hypothetical protein
MKPRAAVLAAAALLSAGAGAVPLRYPQGDLHGFPSMRDTKGNLIALGELTQKLLGDHLVVHAVWRFRDGRIAEEDARMRTGGELQQESFAWLERREGAELRRIEVDFRSGRATVAHGGGGKQEHWEAKLDLPAGKAFAGYCTAVAVSQLDEALAAKDARVELTFVAFTPKPRTVTLEVSRAEGDSIRAAGRSIPADRYTLHPKIPFPISVFVHAPDAHLWFTHAAPPALLRAEQGLVEKDDPTVIIDVVARGELSSPSGRRAPARPHE